MTQQGYAVVCCEAEQRVVPDCSAGSSAMAYGAHQSLTCYCEYAGCYCRPSPPQLAALIGTPTRKSTSTYNQNLLQAFLLQKTS